MKKLVKKNNITYCRKTPIKKFQTGGKSENTGLFGNPTVDEIASYLPVLGTLEDGYQLITHPSWSNLGYFGASLGADVLGVSALRGLKAARKILRASKNSVKNTKNALDNYRHILNREYYDKGLIPPSRDIKKVRNLEDLYKDALWNKATKSLMPYLEGIRAYPIYFGVKGIDASFNYNQQHSGNERKVL